jgi:hypothetical protein
MPPSPPVRILPVGAERAVDQAAVEVADLEPSMRWPKYQLSGSAPCSW